jgi:hypothetical protein
MDDFKCSFCGKNRREVKKLISGPRIFICDECVGLCVDILNEEERKNAPLQERSRGTVMLDDWSWICLDALDCRVIWPEADDRKDVLALADIAADTLLPEVFGKQPAGAATVIAVRDFDRACACLRLSGYFDGAEELREAGATRAALFRTSAGNLAAVVATELPAARRPVEAQVPV